MFLAGSCIISGWFLVGYYISGWFLGLVSVLFLAGFWLVLRSIIIFRAGF
jgi:hypothetical protein